MEGNPTSPPCDTPNPCDGQTNPQKYGEININTGEIRAINKETSSNFYQPKVVEVTIPVPGTLESEIPEARKKLLKQKQMQEEFEF